MSPQSPLKSQLIIVCLSLIQTVLSCPGKLLSVTPEVAHVTTLNENGGWYRDPFQHSNRIYYMGWSEYDTSSVYEYGSFPNTKTNPPLNFVRLYPRADGTGFVVYDGNVYYNKEASRTIVKFDIIKTSSTKKDLPNANYHGTSPYAIELNTDIDFAVDETGLWAIYATESNDGDIVVSKLNKDTLAVIDTWHTSYEKRSALNAFITCGVLYVINYDSLEIDYMYNMTSRSDSRIRISIPKLNVTTSSVQYNPRDQTLYIWDSGVASQYNITFQAVVPSTTVTPSTLSSTVSTTISTSTLTTLPPPNPSTVHPNDPPSSSIPSSSSPSVIHGSCPGMEVQGLNWPATSFSKTAVLSCPGESDNYAVWVCGGNPTHPNWNTPEPDFSSCVSDWIESFEKEIEDGRYPVGYSSQILTKRLYSNKNTITSWDIISIIKLLRRLLEDATSTSSASQLADSTLKITSELLQPALIPLWQHLGRNVQTQSVIELSKILEEAAFFLSKDYVDRGTEEKNNWSHHQSYASLAIRIEPVLDTESNQQNPAETKLKKVTFYSNDGDVVTVEDRALMDALEAQSGDKMVIVHLTMNNLARNIVDQKGLGAPPYPANSQIITISVRRMLDTGSWAKRTEPLKLAYPIQMQLRHNDLSYSKHVCAFWNQNLDLEDDGYWWRSGCRRIGGNSSHSTCECNHLTNFVILSSNGDFPPMGYEEDIVDTEKTLSDLFIFINVVRGGAIISILMLVVVVILLFCWRISSDLITIHKNLAITVVLTQLVLIVGVTFTQLPQLCAAIAGFLHFSVLSTFTWAAIETVHHLLTLHDTQERRNCWKYYYVIGYVTPLLVVGISAAIDHTGYDNQTACWLCTNGHFIWSIVVPCVVAICLSIACIALLLYRLNKRNTTTSSNNIIKILRWDAIKTCVLMPLLCIMWSCAFLWLSGMSLMAWIFAASSLIYGAATLILRCFYRTEDQNSWSLPKFTKKTTGNRFSHSGNPSSAGLLPSSYRPSLRGDGSTPSFDYRYAASSRSATATTHLSKTGTACPYPSVGSVGEELALIPVQRPVPTFAHDHLVRVRAAETEPRNSFSSFDDGESRNLRGGSMHSRVEHLDCRSSCPDSSSRSSMMPGGCSSGFRVPHQYERPSTSERYCSCTTSTSYSCCYDRLHEEHLRRGSSGSKTKGLCSKCMMERGNPSYLQHRCSTHQYETLGPFEDEDESNQENHPSCQRSYDEVEPDERCVQPIHDYHVTGHSQPRIFHQQRHPDIPESTCAPGSNWQNSSYGICRCPHAVGGKIAKHDYYPRNGRNSDPLSTDQGYDTDSQQPGGYRVSRHSHSDGDDFRGTPGSTPGASSKMNSIVEGYPTEEDTQILLHRNDSLSGGSDNDREVEFINSTSTATTSSPNTNLKHSLQGLLVLPSAHDEDGVIDTSLGGRNSVTETVHSWSALPGSNPRSSYPDYGLPKTDRKTTADPHIILAQAKQNTENRLDADPNVSGTATNAYTLPGTSEAGTKARIDLRTGGISMITNL